MVDCPDDVKQIIFEDAVDQNGFFLHRPLFIDIQVTEQCVSWREGLINEHYKQIFVWVRILNPAGWFAIADKKRVARRRRQHGHEPSSKR
jgi:hypothetical protein